MRTTIAALIAITALSPLAVQVQKESHATDRLDAATDVLKDMMHADDKGIPQDLMNKANCVVVVPNMKKAGFIFGAKYGRGFATCRRASNSGWTAPAGIRIEGGSFGLQIGGTEQDAVILVMNERGMKHLRESKFNAGWRRDSSSWPGGQERLRPNRRETECGNAFLVTFARRFCRNFVEGHHIAARQGRE